MMKRIIDVAVALTLLIAGSPFSFSSMDSFGGKSERLWCFDKSGLVCTDSRLCFINFGR